MDFAQQQRSPTRHLAGLSVVILIHAIVIWALVTGLARKVVEVIKQPLETKIIEEVKPPPPPEVMPPPPPKLAAPPPPFIPPPEVQIQQPVQQQPTISAVTNVKPTEPPPPIAPRAEAPPAPKPAVTSVAVACPNVRSIAGEISYPAKAQRAGINSGEVVVQFVISGSGEIKNPTIVKSTNRLFDNTALEAAKMLKCVGQGADTTVQWPIGFKIPD
jgi:protein TonB